VRPSRVDRFSPDPPEHPGGVSAEVYVSVGDDGRGALWRGLRYLGLAAVVVVAVVVLVFSSLPSGRKTSPATPRPIAAASKAPRSLLLLLASHPYLPRNVKQLVNHDSCAGSRSAALERGVEAQYAQAVADASGAVLPGRAKLQATTYPRC
jgi:hypothetical protein